MRNQKNNLAHWAGSKPALPVAFLLINGQPYSSKLFSWKQLTGNEITCESDRNVVRVTFFLKNNLDKATAEIQADALELDIKALQKRLGEKLGIKYSVKYSVNRWSILCIIIFYPRITRNDLAKILDISISAVDKNLLWLRQEGVLERIGADRNGYWQINLE